MGGSWEGIVTRELCGVDMDVHELEQAKQRCFGELGEVRSCHVSQLGEVSSCHVSQTACLVSVSGAWSRTA